MNQPEDVEVILSHDRRYKFHCGVLARNSNLLSDMLTEKNAIRLSPRAKTAGITVRWMIRLTQPPQDDSPGRLELVKLDSMAEPVDPMFGLVVNNNGRVPSRALDLYEAVFYAFYNAEIPLHDAEMPNALTDVIEIIKIAEYLQCVTIISKPIDVALVKHGQDLFRAVQSRPWAWVGMAVRIRSELIFKEAIIHLAGNWRKIKGDKVAMRILSESPPEVRSLCEEKHKSLIAMGKKLELAVASIYPGGMSEPSKDLPIKREEYAKDILVWMALSFFRHWLSQRIISERGCLAADSGYELYHQLHQSGEVYMDKTVVNQFHGKFPMTKKAMNVLENHLAEIKECIKGVVDMHGLMKSTCQLDTHRYPVDYLTCAKIQKEDFPWHEEVQLETRGQKRRLGGNEIVQRNLAAAKRFAELEDEEDEDEDAEVELSELQLRIATAESKRSRRK